MGALSGGSKAPSVVEGGASNALQAQHYRTATPARCNALRRLSTIASALSYYKELFPDDVSTRGDVDACSRASRALELIILA